MSSMSYNSTISFSSRSRIDPLEKTKDNWELPVPAASVTWLLSWKTMLSRSSGLTEFALLAIMKNILLGTALPEILAFEDRSTSKYWRPGVWPIHYIKKQERGNIHFPSYWLQTCFHTPKINYMYFSQLIPIPREWPVNFSGAGTI